MSKNHSMALIPCPFCGQTDLLQTDQMVLEYDETTVSLPDGEPAEEWFVVCGNCGAMGPMSPSAEQAHIAWNRRA